MTRVWRWEGRDDGLGPYRWTEDRELRRNYRQLRVLLDLLHESGSHPGPRQDGLMEELEDGWHFACPSRETLDEWFNDIGTWALRSAGMVIHVYDVPDHLVKLSSSKRQCAYRSSHAVLVAVHTE